MNRCVLLIPLFICAVAANALARVDSMDIGDNTMSWRSFVTDEPATAFAESGGMLWYATASGMGFYSIKTNMKTVIVDLGGLSATGVTDMAPDKGRGVWIGTSEGVAFTTDGKAFEVYTSSNGLADNAVNRIHVTPRGAVWAGSDKGVSVFKGGSWKTYTTADGLPGDNVRDIASGAGSTVYVATNRGIGVFSGSAWTAFNQTNGLSANDVKAVAWDGRRAELWAAVGQSDVNSYDGTKWNDFMDVQNDIACIMVDTQSRIWVGSSSGIIKYNGFEWIYDPAKMPFPATVCNKMYRDSGGNLWYAIDTGVMRLENPYPY